MVIDNYDSFTHNLVHLIETCGAEVDVYRNDIISIDEAGLYKKIMLSPGPGLPKEAGIMPKLITMLAPSASIFGICLGMQAIVESFGGQLNNLVCPIHGQPTRIDIVLPFDPVFKNLPASFSGGHYHSWVADREKLPECLKVTSVDDKGNIMSVRHHSFDVCGVQFHPESVMTPLGKTIIENWLQN